MSASSRLLELGLSVATFLAAAKAHGRQLRLERELAGYWHASFSERNPPFIESLWSRERIAFWSIAAAISTVTIVVRVVGPRLGLPVPRLQEFSFVRAFVVHLAVPMITAFVVTGLASLARFATATRAGLAFDEARPDQWASAARWGSAGWWALALSLGVVLTFVLWRRPNS